ncbi:hypothetical protein ISN44_As01g060600 [Arabidopsis suecica]|uniref:Uncharacterized protein n=1 Tax=Arabidopsis suecica TaxID=45249 RepID=A0A8T2HII9_ARASU|nr:hypothetical protein ISN44_As01g060600 [Arabidopsis suecica]
MTHVLVRRQGQGKKRRWDVNMTMYFFLFFFVFYVSFQIVLSSSASVGYSRLHLVASPPPPPPRKALRYSTAPFRGPLSRDDIYGDDKRVVHTGPNPLHN